MYNTYTAKTSPCVCVCVKFNDPLRFNTVHTVDVFLYNRQWVTHFNGSPAIKTDLNTSSWIVRWFACT